MDEVPSPQYSRDDVTTGVVHFGVGGFHRAHQAMYHDRLMNEGKALDWGICGVGVMPADAKMRDVLRAQDGLYTLVVKHADGTWDAAVIGSIVEYLFAPDDPEAVIEKLAAPATRIVSLTVTEGGYNLDDDDRRVRRGRPGRGGTTSSRARPPRTVVRARDRGAAAPARARASRRSRSCPATTSRATARSRARRSPRSPACATRSSATGSSASVAFPNSMVDRITPGDHRRRPRGGARALRRRGPLAGGLRAVHPVGARGRVQRRAAAVRGRRRAGRRRRRALRADEAAAAQREPPGDRATSATCAATGSCTTPRRTRCSATSCSRYMDEEATPTLAPVPGRRPRRVQARR